MLARLLPRFLVACSTIFWVSLGIRPSTKMQSFPLEHVDPQVSLIFEPAEMNRFTLDRFELAGPILRRCRLMSDFTD
jgi:hypothetical protein